MKYTFIPAKKSHASLVLWAGVALWLIENIYFGWNKEPQSGVERVLDYVSVLMVVIGGLKRVVEETVNEMMDGGTLKQID